MIKLVKYYFEYKDRPEVFKRGTQKIPTPKKFRNRKASNGISPVIKE